MERAEVVTHIHATLREVMDTLPPALPDEVASIRGGLLNQMVVLLAESSDILEAGDHHIVGGPYVHTHEHQHPDHGIPNPGSAEALRAGCICAVMDNNHGEYPPRPPDGWYITVGCPMHTNGSKEKEDAGSAH